MFTCMLLLTNLKLQTLLWTTENNFADKDGTSLVLTIDLCCFLWFYSSLGNCSWQLLLGTSYWAREVFVLTQCTLHTSLRYLNTFQVPRTANTKPKAKSTKKKKTKTKTQQPKNPKTKKPTKKPENKQTKKISKNQKPYTQNPALPPGDHSVRLVT